MRVVRAAYTASTITVYQAYPKEIAQAAVRAGTFVPPFKRERMTWIKPSFLWMMYRSGWATKPEQEHVLSIELTRQGFEWALERASLSHFDSAVHQELSGISRFGRTSASVSVPTPDLRPVPARLAVVGTSIQFQSYCCERGFLLGRDNAMGNTRPASHSWPLSPVAITRRLRSGRGSRA